MSALTGIAGAIVWLTSFTSSVTDAPPTTITRGNGEEPVDEPSTRELGVPLKRAPTRHVARRRLGRLSDRKRRVLLALGTAVATLAIASSVIAFFSAGSVPGDGGAAQAGSVNQVTGLGFDTGGITPTANPDVPLTWDAATLSDDVTPVLGYVVNRYDNADVLQTTGASCDATVSGTSCIESGVPDGEWTYRTQGKFYNWLGLESDELTVQVDTSAPSVDTAPQDPSADPDPSFAFSHPTYSSFKRKLDGGRPASRPAESRIQQVASRTARTPSASRQLTRTTSPPRSPTTHGPLIRARRPSPSLQPRRAPTRIRRSRSRTALSRASSASSTAAGSRHARARTH